MKRESFFVLMIALVNKNLERQDADRFVKRPDDTAANMSQDDTAANMSQDDTAANMSQDDTAVANLKDREWLRLRAMVEAQQAIAEAGLNLDKVMCLIAERMQAITGATGGVVELAEDDEMVYRAASGTAQPYLGLRLQRENSLSGLCVTTGEVLCCDDAEEDARVNREACRRVGAHSMIVVPLMQDKSAVGVLKVLSSHRRAFGDEDVQTLQLMASLLGNVLSQAAEYKAKQTLLEEKTQTLEALRESEQRFRNSFDAAAIGKALVGLDGRWIEVNDALCNLLGYEESELLQLTFQDITHPDDLMTDLGFVQEMLSSTRQSYQMEKRYFHKDRHIVWVLLCVSMVRDNDGHPFYFVSEILDITGQKNAMALLLQANNELENLALFDALTGIHNRRAFDERLEKEISIAHFVGEAFSLVLFDLDHFKRHNDTHGHSSGDEVLRIVGQVLRSELHPRDFAARYGGEEFALILPRTDHVGALCVAEKLQRAFLDYAWPNENITASFGVATWNGEDAATLLHHADRALYAAKAGGRNRVCCGE